MTKEIKKTNLDEISRNAYSSGKAYGRYEVIELVEHILGKEQTQKICDKLGILIPVKIKIVEKE